MTIPSSFSIDAMISRRRGDVKELEESRQGLLCEEDMRRGHNLPIGFFA
jgi:hypothetical protein